MRIESLHVSGFQSNSFQEGILLDDLGNLNVLIGANNSGKSSVSRCVALMKKQMWRFRPNNLFPNNSQVQSDFLDIDYYNHDHGNPIALSIGLGIEDSDLIASNGLTIGPANLPKRFKATSHLKKIDNSFDANCTLFFDCLENEIWNRVLSNSSGYYNPYWEMLFKFYDNVHFFDAYRGLKQMNKNGFFNGAGVTDQLFSLQQTAGTKAEAQFKRISDDINSLLSDGSTNFIEKISVKGLSESDREINIVTDGVDKGIESMGAGIAELIMLCTQIRLNSKRGSVFFIEEPEIHLHPRLLRKLIMHLKSFQECQFIVSTHSNVLLDCLDDEDRIFHIQHSASLGSTAIPCIEFVRHHDMLDDLGFSSSSLLLSNCVIWVEGPSDKKYLDCWIQLACKAKGIELKPKIDYTFISYGGVNLYHHTLDLGKGDATFWMLSVCRRAVIVGDRDKKVGAKLNQTKERIIKEAEHNDIRCRTHFMDAWTIENQIEPDVLIHCLKIVLDLPGDKLKGLSLDNKSAWPDQLAKFLNIPSEDVDSFKNKVNGKKVELSELIVKELNKAETPKIPQCVNEIVDFISQGKPH